MGTSYCWILDSGGAGRGAWQGGVIYEFMRWCLENGTYPLVTMGASAGGYAAADVATGTEQTIMKGWTYWGTETARSIAACCAPGKSAVFSSSNPGRAAEAAAESERI